MKRNISDLWRRLGPALLEKVYVNLKCFLKEVIIHRLDWFYEIDLHYVDYIYILLYYFIIIWLPRRSTW